MLEGCGLRCGLRLQSEEWNGRHRTRWCGDTSADPSATVIVRDVMALDPKIDGTRSS
jgi:hypothetical protein